MQGLRPARAPAGAGSTVVNHEPGTEHHPVGGPHRLDGLGAGRGLLGQQVHLDAPGPRSWRRPPARAAVRSASGRQGPALAQRPRCRAAPRPSAAPGHGRRAAGPPSPARPPGRRAAATGRRSAGCRASGCPADHALWNRCCSTSRHSRPHSPSSHSADRAIRRSPGGSTPNSRAQPARGTAVVGHRHDGRQLVGEVAQRLQGGGQPVAPAQGHDRGRALIPAPGPGARWSACAPGGACQQPPPAPRSSPPSGACRRCSRPRGWRSACPPAGTRRAPVRAVFDVAVAGTLSAPS